MIDLDKLSLETLLALTRKLRIIEHYEFDQQHVLIIISREPYHVSRGRARSILKEILIDWRERQYERSRQLNPSGERRQPVRVFTG